MRGMTRCLLGRPAIEALQVIKWCEPVDKAENNLSEVAMFKLNFLICLKALES